MNLFTLPEGQLRSCRVIFKKISKGLVGSLILACFSSLNGWTQDLPHTYKANALSYTSSPFVKIRDKPS